MEKFVRKVPNDRREDSFYILIIEWSEHINLTVLDDDTAWKGCVNSNQINHMCNSVYKTRDEYLIELKHALTKSKDDYIYIRNEEKFIIKKVDLKSEIKIQFCTIKLTEIPALNAYISLTSKLLKEEENSKSLISELTFQVSSMKSEREEFKRKLKQFTEEKKSIETLLYSKFCELLNAKKRKIALLESHIGAGGDASPQFALESNVQSTSTESIGKKNVLNISDIKHNSEKNIESRATVSNCAVPSTSTSVDDNHYSSETDVDTDVESECTSQTLKSTKNTSSIYDLLEDEPQKIILKRSSNSIRGQQSKKANIAVEKNQYSEIPKQGTSQSSSSNEIEEFNSQSLLDEFCNM